MNTNTQKDIGEIVQEFELVGEEGILKAQLIKNGKHLMKLVYQSRSGYVVEIVSVTKSRFTQTISSDNNEEIDQRDFIYPLSELCKKLSMQIPRQWVKAIPNYLLASAYIQIARREDDDNPFPGDDSY